MFRSPPRRIHGSSHVLANSGRNRRGFIAGRHDFSLEMVRESSPSSCARARERREVRKLAKLAPTRAQARAREGRAGVMSTSSASRGQRSSQCVRGHPGHIGHGLSSDRRDSAIALARRTAENAPGNFVHFVNCHRNSPSGYMSRCVWSPVEQELSALSP